MTERFDLSYVIRQVLGRGEAGVDPETVAKAVMREVPPRMYGEALAQALRMVMSNFLSRERTQTSITPAVLDRERDGEPGEVIETPVKRSKPRAYNQQAYAAHHWKAIQVAECVAGAWKRLGECTAADLAWLSQDRRKRAAEHVAKADGYAHLGDIVTRHGVQTVEELPEDVLAATFQPRSHHANGEAA